jgi:hypothetical protein
MSKEIDELQREIQGMLNKDGIKDQNDLMIKLSILKHYDLNRFMETMYQAFISNSERVIDSRASSESRIKAMIELIEHFKGKEEYEKCQQLYNMQQKIESKSE